MKRPPKKNLAEAINLLEREAKLLKQNAQGQRDFASQWTANGNLVDGFWLASATLQSKKAERLSVVVEWLQSLHTPAKSGIEG